MDSEIVKKRNRILYVEPNDVYGNVDGVALTPDYSDYCISVNLIAEVVSRNRNGDEQQPLTYIISWSTPPEKSKGSKPKWISFLSGKDAEIYGGKGNFLTTYYTDINYNDILNENIVEGLGIESVEVAFESYYTPTITIKFVDVRGSSLFGREEVMHNEKKSNDLSSSSVFGVFFTIPYPKFKLQIKGFFGRAVTYQLTCSGFKASFNSQTGNFEAVATFIGYSYSLLTDIPLRYIISAPNCAYDGEKYWNEHVNSPEWALSNKKPPRTLIEIINKIGSLDEDKLKKYMMKDSEKVELSNRESKIASLEEINNTFVDFAGSIKQQFENTGIIEAMTDNNKHYSWTFVMSDNEDVVIDYNIIEKYSIFLQKVSDYNNSFDDPINDNFLCNKKKTVFDTNLTFKQIGKRDANNKFTFVCGEQTVGAISNISLNDDIKVGEDLANRLYERRNVTETSNGAIKGYGYIFKFNGIQREIGTRIERLKKENDDLDKVLLKRIPDRSEEILGFKPSLGNVFKIIMCHLETFIHMMWTCYDKIENDALNGHRSPEYLKIPVACTDFVNLGEDKQKRVIGAWPGVFNNSKYDKNPMPDNDNTLTSLEWIGHYSDRFEEEKLVTAIYKAAERNSQEAQVVNQDKTTFDGLPIMPGDISKMFNKTTIFASDITDSLSDLAGYLSFRVAQISCVLGSGLNIYETLGKMDAYNYFIHNPNKDYIKENIINKLGNDSIVDVIYNISICKNGYDKFGKTYNQTNTTCHSFETRFCSRYDKQGRHPMFKENNNSLQYIHYYSKNNSALIPDRFEGYGIYDTLFKYEGDGNDGYYNIISPKNGGFIHTAKSKDLLGVSEAKDYVNADMFEVQTPSDKAEKVLTKYNEIKTGNFTVLGKNYNNSEFGNIISSIWHIDEYDETFDEDNIMTINKLSVNGLVLYPSKDAEKTNFNGKHKFSDTEQFKNVQYILDKDNTFIGELKYPTNDGTLCISLFGNAFYYAQNNDERTNRGESKDVMINRQNHAKALLFLHSFLYSYKNANLAKSGVHVVPYACVLLMGALLWRRKYMVSHNSDPIQYPNKSVGIGIKKPSSNETFFIKEKNKYIFHPLPNNSITKYASLNEVFSMEDDEVVTNKLIDVFEQFVNSGDWETIRNGLELKNNSELYTETTFIEDKNKFLGDYDRIKNGNEKTYPLSNSGSFVLPNEYIFRQLKDGVYFSNFFDNYRFIAKCGNKKIGFFLFINPDSTIQGNLKDLYFRKVVVLKSFTELRGGMLSVSQSNFRKYLDGFGQQLSSLTVKEFEPQFTDTESGIDRSINKDFLLPIYLYLKMLWDKWLIPSKTKDYYNVSNFFKSFFFIDAFYRNIYDKFMINMDVIRTSYMGRDKDGSLFNFIGDITSQHRCLFLALPDFLNTSDTKDNNAVEKLKDIFRPLPYNEMNRMDDENKFVVIYTPRVSEVPSSVNNFREDSVRIWNPAKNDWDPKMPDTFDYVPYDDNGNADEDKSITRYGYYVPSFGVAFSRQNNHLFKNISLDMSTPLVTSQSINVLANIAQMGSSGSHKVAFVGQDLYPVFSNYSYLCEIEMMGDAQIQPLMYFQLMNIPMWSGVYMIFNVTHTISAGSMTTKFKGMKISRNPLPYNSSWYTIFNSPLDINGNDYTQANGGFSSGSGNGGGWEVDYDFTALNHYEIEFSENQEPQVKSLGGGSEKQTYYILRCMRFFVYVKDLTVNQAAGIVGNFMGEGLGGHDQSYIIDSNGRKSFGISMMNEGGELPYYQTYCKERGYDWRAVDPQLNYIYDLVKGTYLNTGYHKELSDAFAERGLELEYYVKAFARGYEGCDGCGRDGKWTAIPARLDNAKEAIKLYQKYRKDGTSGNNGEGLPILVGDSWAYGMRDYFRIDTGGTPMGIGGVQVSRFTPGKPNKEKSACEQIEEAMRKPQKPRYILMYCGLNTALRYRNDNGTIKRMYDDCCKAANGIQMYVSQLTYVNNINEKNEYSSLKTEQLKDIVDNVNNIITDVCGPYDNVKILRMTETERQNFKDTYVQIGYHPSQKGYQVLYGMIKSKM